MAVWIQILLWVITNLPDLWRLVQEIIELIKKMPKPDQPAAKAELMGALKTYKVNEHGHKLPRASWKRPEIGPLARLHERLKQRYG